MALVTTSSNTTGVLSELPSLTEGNAQDLGAHAFDPLLRALISLPAQTFEHKFLPPQQLLPDWQPPSAPRNDDSLADPDSSVPTPFPELALSLSSDGPPQEASDEPEDASGPHTTVTTHPAIAIGSAHAPTATASPLAFWDQVAAVHAQQAGASPHSQAQVHAAVEHVALTLHVGARRAPGSTDSPTAAAAETATRSADILSVFESLLGCSDVSEDVVRSELLRSSDATTQATWRKRAESAVFTCLTLRDATLLGTLGRRG